MRSKIVWSLLLLPLAAQDAPERAKTETLVIKPERTIEFDTDEFDVFAIRYERLDQGNRLAQRLTLPNDAAIRLDDADRHRPQRHVQSNE